MSSLLRDSLGIVAASLAVAITVLTITLAPLSTYIPLTELPLLWKIVLGTIVVSFVTVTLGGILVLTLLRRHRILGLLSFCAAGFIVASTLFGAAEVALVKVPAFDGSISAWTRVAGVCLRAGSLGIIAGAILWAVAGRATRSNNLWSGP